MTLEAFKRRIEEAHAAGAAAVLVPVHKRLSADLLTPVSAFLKLRQGSRYPFLLESVEGGDQVARYSFIGRNPYRVLKAFGEKVRLEFYDEDQDEPDIIEPTGRHFPDGDVFEVLRYMLDQFTQIEVPGLPRLVGGAVGYLGYDAVRLLEDLPEVPEDDLGLPDAVWCFYKTLVAFDHVKHQLVLIHNAPVESRSGLEGAYAQARGQLDLLEATLSRRAADEPEPVTLPDAPITSNIERDAFEDAVEQAQAHIYEGDLFQVVLSRRFGLPFAGDGFNLYRALRQVNPSPYLFYLDFEEFALAGSSPEVLARVEDGRAEVLPIAGTRRRGATEAEDRALEEELLADAKERAEHLMLVDLGRNDLGRVCRYGSIEVERYATIERYSHVMHLVSSVTGRLAPGRHVVDALAACFPAGTVSGAPKVRAMEIIDRLEPTRRGVYAGAVGYVDARGRLDTCIAIRTMVLKDETAYVQAGAGIVADSDPAREFEETAEKAQALREAMRVAAEGLL